MSHLNGRIALITGASQGIGRACALELAKAGATVALAARSADKLEAAAAEIVAAGGQARAYALDVSSEESIKACAKTVLADLGKVDILVNNAGITKDGLALRMKLADFDDVLRTNLTGAFLLTQALLALHPPETPLAVAIGRDRKGRLSAIAYLVAVGLAFFEPWVAIAIYVGVAVVWLVPDRRITRVMDRFPKEET